MADEEADVATTADVDMQGDEDEMATPEEKLQIVQHFLLNAPPGQFGEVLSDVQVLVPSDLIEESMLKGIARAYNCAQYMAAPEESGERKVLICKEGEVDPTHYIHTVSGQVLEVDHVRRVAFAANDVDTLHMSTLEEERKQVESKVKEYVVNQYGRDASTECAVYCGDEEKTLTVVIRGERINLRNFWSGNWISIWAVGLNPAASITGTIKVRAHYFEDGNVQLQTSKAHPETPLDATKSLGDAVVDAVQAAESKLQSGLEEMYVNMTDETFKAMRRVMPITRTKMKWNINEVALNRNLRK